MPAFGLAQLHRSGFMPVNFSCSMVKKKKTKKRCFGSSWLGKGEGAGKSRLLILADESRTQKEILEDWGSHHLLRARAEPHCKVRHLGESSFTKGHSPRGTSPGFYVQQVGSLSRKTHSSHLPCETGSLVRLSKTLSSSIFMDSWNGLGWKEP